MATWSKQPEFKLLGNLMNSDCDRVSKFGLFPSFTEETAHEMDRLAAVEVKPGEGGDHTKRYAVTRRVVLDNPEGSLRAEDHQNSPESVRTLVRDPQKGKAKSKGKGKSSSGPSSSSANPAPRSSQWSNSNWEWRSSPYASSTDLSKTMVTVAMRPIGRIEGGEQGTSNAPSPGWPLSKARQK